MNVFTIAIDAISSIFTDVVLAVLLLFIGLVLGRLLGKLLYLFLHEFDLDASFHRIFGFNLPLEYFLGSLLTFVLYGVFAIFALTVLHIAQYVVSILAISVGVVIVLYMFLGMKDFISNVIGGIYVFSNKALVPGIMITTQSVTGIIKKITLMEVQIISKDGDFIALPTAAFIKQPYILHADERAQVDKMVTKRNAKLKKRKAKK